MMKNNAFIQLKAVFLLIAFSLNTVVGFACSVGLHPEFNDSYHEEAISHNPAPQHADRFEHHHHGAKDGCCHDNVVKFQNLDKNLNPNAKIIIEAPVFVALLPLLTGFEPLKPAGLAFQKQAVQFFYPPPGDIRVIIQSFQI